eukprot:765692-Hanusia_phi.AAC.7
MSAESLSNPSSEPGHPLPCGRSDLHSVTVTRYAPVGPGLLKLHCRSVAAGSHRVSHFDSSRGRDDSLRLPPGGGGGQGLGGLF